MHRRLLAALLGVMVVAATAGPALGHVVNYTTRETGTHECDFDENVRTDIRANGHHRHSIVGFTSVFFHTPGAPQSHTWVIWSTFAGQWSTSNQQNFAYSFSGSGGGCTI
jgi:hypothetical protein